MSVSVVDRDQLLVDGGVVARDSLQVSHLPEPAEEEPDWWAGLAFEGVLDPGGPLFAGLLAGLATLSVVVVAFAVVAIVTGG